MSASTWPRWPTDKTVGSRWIVRLTVGEGSSCESLTLLPIHGLVTNCQNRRRVGRLVGEPKADGFLGQKVDRPSRPPTRRSTRWSSRKKPEGGKTLGHC